VVLASDALYDAAGRLTQLKYGSFTATWQFNVRGQLNRLKAAHSNPVIDGVDLEYAYSTQDVANNGRLRTQHDRITGELLYFDYDELNRLRAVETIDAVTPEGAIRVRDLNSRSAEPAQPRITPSVCRKPGRRNRCGGSLAPAFRAQSSMSESGPRAGGRSIMKC
jgi:hypothetical protein